MRFGGLYIRLYARSHAKSHARSNAKSYTRLYNHRSYDHGVTIAFLFGMSSKKLVIVKSYFQLGKKKPLNPMGGQKEKPVLLSMQKTS